jgi:hypothetical protein
LFGRGLFFFYTMTKKRRRTKPNANFDGVVAQGAAYLDEVLPDWVSRIDLRRLDLYENSDCILGQLWGHVAYSMPELRDGQRTKTMRLLGFWVEGLRIDEAALLHSAWVRLIESRREEGQPRLPDASDE